MKCLDHVISKTQQTAKGTAVLLSVAKCITKSVFKCLIIGNLLAIFGAPLHLSEVKAIQINTITLKRIYKSNQVNHKPKIV